jgi:hypothetical protein
MAERRKKSGMDAMIHVPGATAECRARGGASATGYHVRKFKMP